MVYDHASRDSFDPSRTARAFGSDDDDDDDDDATRIAREASPSRPPSSNASIAPNGRMGVAAALVDANEDDDRRGRDGARWTHDAQRLGTVRANTHVTCPCVLLSGFTSRTPRAAWRFSRDDTYTWCRFEFPARRRARGGDLVD